MNIRTFAAALTALAVVSAAPLLAQDKMGGGKMTGKHKTGMKGHTMSSGVYVCKECKGYYSAADARKMGMKDSMGHKLVRMKKAPAGYKMMHMGGKMSGGKMMHGKTGGGRM